MDELCKFIYNEANTINLDNWESFNTINKIEKSKTSFNHLYH